MVKFQGQNCCAENLLIANSSAVVCDILTKFCNPTMHFKYFSILSRPTLSTKYSC